MDIITKVISGMPFNPGSQCLNKLFISVKGIHFSTLKGTHCEPVFRQDLILRIARSILWDFVGGSSILTHSGFYLPKKVVLVFFSKRHHHTIKRVIFFDATKS